MKGNGQQGAAWRLAWLAGIPPLLLLVTVPRWPDYEEARLALLALLAPLTLVAWAGPTLRGRVPLPASGLAGLGLFSAAPLLSLLAGPEPRSWLVALGYQTGLVGLLLAAAALPAGTRLRPLLSAWGGAGAVAAAVGLLQAAGWDPLQVSVPHEAGSLLGNRNAATELAAVVAPFLAGAALATRITPAGRLAAGAVAVLLVFHAGLARGRAGLLALAAGVALAALLGRGRWWTAAGRGAGGLAAGGLIWFAGYQLAPLPPAAPALPAEAASRPVETIRLEAGRPAGDPVLPATWEVRLRVWRSTLRLALESPLTGHGAGSFERLFPRVRDPEEIRISSQDHAFETRVARAHCDPLQLAAETGVTGLAGYVLLLAAALGAGLKAGREDPLAAGLAGTAAAFAVHGLFRSPLYNAPAAAFAFVALGLLLRRGSTTPEGPRVPTWLVWSAAGFLLLPAWQGLAAFRAECLASGALGAKDRPAALAALSAAVEANPDHGMFRLMRARENLWSPSQEELALALVDLDRALALRPFDPLALRTSAYALFLASDRISAGREDPAAIAVKKEKALAGAEERARRSLALDPRNPATLAILARVLEARGDYPEAIQYFHHLSRHPGYGEILRQRSAGIAQGGNEAASCLYLMAWLEDRPEAVEEWRELARRWRALGGHHSRADLCQARYHRGMALRLLGAGDLSLAAVHAGQLTRLAEAGDRFPFLLQAVLAMVQRLTDEAAAWGRKLGPEALPLTGEERKGLEPWLPRLRVVPPWDRLLPAE